MSLVMVRIDDRLIHGQVVVAWCPQVKPDRLLLCDDEVAGSDWEREIYKAAASDYETTICSVEQTVEKLESGEYADEKVFLIVGSPAVIIELLNRGLHFDKVVIGGMHFQPGKRQIAPFIYVDDEDIANFRILLRHNIELEARDVPGCKPLNITKLLGLIEA